MGTRKGDHGRRILHKLAENGRLHLQPYAFMEKDKTSNLEIGSVAKVLELVLETAPCAL